MYQVDPVLPYYSAAVLYGLLTVAMVFLARRVTVHRPEQQS